MNSVAVDNILGHLKKKVEIGNYHKKIVSCPSRWPTIETTKRNMFGIGEAIRQYKEKKAIKFTHTKYKRGVNESSESGLTPLLEAVKAKDIPSMRQLIRAGADVNIQEINPPHYTPLYYAIANSDFDAIDLLIRHGANTELRDSKGYTPVDFAIANNFNESACLIIRKYGIFQDSNILTAIDSKNFLMIELMIRMRYGLNYVYQGDYEKDIAYNFDLLERFKDHQECKILLMGYGWRREYYDTELMSQPGYPPQLFLVERRKIEAIQQANRKPFLR